MDKRDNVINWFVECVFVLAVATLISFGVGMAVGRSAALSYMRKQAIDHGYASWSVSSDGKVSWSWNEK